MAKPKRVRWECPVGEHKGVLGPQRPRTNNICRYCLPCSEKSGVLVERVAPSVEKKRAADAEKAAAKRKAKAQREKAKEDAKWMRDGVDMRKEFKRMCRLPIFGGPKGKMAKHPPEFVLRHGGGTGHAWPGWMGNRIVVSCDGRYSTLCVMLHELSHIHAGYDRSDTKRWHGDHWKKTYRQAYYEYFGEHMPGRTTQYS